MSAKWFTEGMAFELKPNQWEWTLVIWERAPPMRVSSHSSLQEVYRLYGFVGLRHELNSATRLLFQTQDSGGPHKGPLTGGPGSQWC